MRFNNVDTFPSLGHEYHPQVATERRTELQRDVAAYLKAGGRIEQIPTGLSGLNKKAMSAHYAKQRAAAGKRGARATQRA